MSSPDAETPPASEGLPADGSGDLRAGRSSALEANLRPDDAITLIYGINHDLFDPTRHHVISAASCTTTALAHMVKPLAKVFGWYDNEYGSYTNLLGDLTVHVHRSCS